VSRARLHEVVGQVSSLDLARLTEAIALYLGE
jgi:hypothetical protein